MCPKANTFLVSREVFGDFISNAPVRQRRFQGDRCGEPSGPVTSLGRVCVMRERTPIPRPAISIGSRRRVPIAGAGAAGSKPLAEAPPSRACEKRGKRANDHVTGLLPNGERHMFPALSRMYGKHDAVLVFLMHLPSNSRCFGSIDSMTGSKSPGSWVVSLTPQLGTSRSSRRRPSRWHSHKGSARLLSGDAT